MSFGRFKNLMATLFPSISLISYIFLMFPLLSNVSICIENLVLSMIFSLRVILSIFIIFLISIFQHQATEEYQGDQIDFYILKY